MRILSMTATFGKLDGQTLTLQPGLNVVSAPNEWGKSTWCAFITAMLYGIDTRERSTKDFLAGKERYAPWSGKPMSGRMDILWKGRKITIERSTKGRSIFGIFRAYETESGLDVLELTGDNCGQALLGVEKSVFTKSAFIQELPIIQDDALRRRLNALVTTGDESGASDQLAQKLKDLKNQCRHNKTGLLPQAQLQSKQLQEKLTNLKDLEVRTARLQLREQTLETQITALENHAAALSFEEAREDAKRVEAAQAAAQTAAADAAALETRCGALPSEEEAQQTLQKLSQLQEALYALQNQEAPKLPEPPAQKAPFLGMDARETEAMLARDLQQYASLKNFRQFIPYILIAVLGLLVTLVLPFVLPQARSFAYLPVVVGLVPLLIKAAPHAMDHKLAFALESKYATADCNLWKVMAQRHIDALVQYEEATARYENVRNTSRQQQEDLQQQVMALTQGAPMTAAQKYWQQVLADRKALDAAKKAATQAHQHAKTLASMIRQVSPPGFADTLTLSAEETSRQLATDRNERQQLHSLLGQVQGQAAMLGSEEQLTRELDAVNRRIEKLELYENALILAQETLAEAAKELQRQFAPKISKRAQALFAEMTDGRYDRLALAEDLSLSAGAQDEDTLHGSLWRSDGTVDQLYLALRLAVAAELTPDAPLVLDDALIRFDETRLAKAMTLLQEEAAGKQVLLFTCHSREQAYM